MGNREKTPDNRSSSPKGKGTGHRLKVANRPLAEHRPHAKQTFLLVVNSFVGDAPKADPATIGMYQTVLSIRAVDVEEVMNVLTDM